MYSAGKRAEELARHQATGNPNPAYLPPLRVGVPDNPIQAIWVFTDPSDWYLDLQLATDVLVGGGVLGRRMEDVPDEAPQVDLFFSNPDLLWANEHSAPRFGQGAFMTCLEALYTKASGPSPVENGIPLLSRCSSGVR